MILYNYKFVSDYAVVVITTDTDKNANAILKETVRDINHFRCDEVEEVGYRHSPPPCSYDINVLGWYVWISIQE